MEFTYIYDNLKYLHIGLFFKLIGICICIQVTTIFLNPFIAI